MSAQPDVTELLARLMEQAPAGFALGLHARLHAPTYMFQTYPTAWLEEYSRDGLLLRDPTVAWGLDNRGVLPWSALRDEDTAGVFDRAKAHGIAHGFVISVESGGSHSLGSFARGDREFTPEEMEAIRATVIELHDATASATPLSAATRDGLRRLSVAFTQPPAHGNIGDGEPPR